MCFDVKFELRRKEELVEGGNIKISSDNEYYCGLVNIDNYGTHFVLGKTNNLDISVADVGNCYLHIFTKEKIYTVAVPYFDELEVNVFIDLK